MLIHMFSCEVNYNNNTFIEPLEIRPKHLSTTSNKISTLNCPILLQSSGILHPICLKAKKVMASLSLVSSISLAMMQKNILFFEGKNVLEGMP